MSDERPLGLTDLADIDEPAVVHAALSRFRKRMFVRAVLIPAAVVAIIAVARLLPGTREPDYKLYNESRNGRIIGVQLLDGPVDVVVLDARRMDDERYAVRLVVSTDQLQGQEELAIESHARGFMRSCEPPAGSPAGEPYAPTMISPIHIGHLGTDKPGVKELLLVCPVGSNGATLEIGALYEAAMHHNPSTGPPPPDEGPRGPGDVPQEECAVPLNELGSCGLTKKQGTYRALATITIDVQQLGVPTGIWRE